MQSSEREQWIAAAKAEIQALIDQDTWKEVPMSEAETKILPGTWAFRRKRSPDGEIRKYKGRYCVRGDLEEGNTQDVYSPVVGWPTVRVFLLLSLLLGWHTISIDFSSAFVQSKLKKPVWIHLPQGFRSNKGPKTCLRLVKSLYGLSVSPILWYETCTKAFMELGFKKSPFDPCLLYKDTMMVVLYVDDAGISYKDEADIDPLIRALQEKGFSLTREGSFAEFLGIKFDRVGDKFKMTQRGLIDKIIHTTGLQNCKPNNMPQSMTALGSDPNGKPMEEVWSYPSVVGMLLYLSCNTRPDIAFAVSQVCRFSSNPKQSHAQAIKTIVRYLSGTRDQGMTFQPGPRLDLDMYVDADFCSLHGIEPASDPNSARSRSAYVIMLSNCPMIWKSQLQPHFSQSTLEAEYSALSYALKTLVPLKRLIVDLVKNLDVSDSTIKTVVRARTFEDNQGAYLLATNQRITSRTKYFLCKYHWFWSLVSKPDSGTQEVRAPDNTPKPPLEIKSFVDADYAGVFTPEEPQEPQQGEFSIHPIKSELQAADYLTKGLPRNAFENNRRIVQGW